MKTIYLLIISAVVLSDSTAFCQRTRFNGPFTIEYQRSVNTYAIIKKMLGKDPTGLDAEKFEVYKKTQPQFKVLKSTLTYQNGNSLFVPAAADISVRQLFDIPFTQQYNTVFTDYSSRRVVSRKDVSGDFLTLTDTIKNIRWKITDETREVMGYHCRRANALILDSVYVVAFYTDEIHVPGGPELFNGLPGMILEIALPHDNVIWRATKVTLSPTLNSIVVEPSRAKPISRMDFNKLIKALFEKRDNATTAKMRVKEYSF